jgi:hypothetical protein
MKINDAIAKADELRLNTISQEQKYTWVYEFEARVAEMMGKEMLRKEFPLDVELMMPDEHEDIYVKYLAAKIDYYNGEGELYANDQVIFEDAWTDARAWYIRTRGAKNYGNWRV